MRKFDSADLQIVHGNVRLPQAGGILGAVATALTGQSIFVAAGRAIDGISDALGVTIEIDTREIDLRVIRKSTPEQGGA